MVAFFPTAYVTGLEGRGFGAKARYDSLMHLQKRGFGSLRLYSYRPNKEMRGFLRRFGLRSGQTIDANLELMRDYVTSGTLEVVLK